MATYEVRISGEVPDEVLRDLGDDVLVADHETRTLITASFVDQAELHGFLQRLRAFGLELVEFRVVSLRDPDASGSDEP